MAMGSDVRFHSIIQLEIHTLNYNPLRGETYMYTATQRVG